MRRGPFCAPRQKPWFRISCELFYILALLASPPVFAAPATDARFLELERLIKSARKAMFIPGIAVSVAEHEQIV